MNILIGFGIGSFSNISYHPNSGIGFFKTFVPNGLGIRVQGPFLVGMKQVYIHGVEIGITLVRKQILPFAQGERVFLCYVSNFWVCI